MRIGIDGTTWNNNRGFGRFTRELLGALFADPGPHNYFFFTDNPPANTQFGAQVETIVVRTGKNVIDAATADSGLGPLQDSLSHTLSAARQLLLRLDTLTNTTHQMAAMAAAMSTGVGTPRTRPCPRSRFSPR